MPCPRCHGRLLQDGDDRSCVNCGFVLYADRDASEEFWKQFQAELPKRDAPAPARDGRKGRVWRKKRYDVA